MYVLPTMQGALQAYEKASQILTDKVGADILLKILKNIGALHFKLHFVGHTAATKTT